MRNGSVVDLYPLKPPELCICTQVQQFGAVCAQPALGQEVLLSSPSAHPGSRL